MTSVHKNMTFSEYLKSYFHLLDSPLRYTRAYKNGFSVMMHLLQNKFPFQAILKNGKKITVHNYYEAYLGSFDILDGFKIDGTIITITKDNFPEIKLDLEEDNGDVHGVFFAEVYHFLNSKNKVVVDIGANIGDSAIYFALSGAEKVIAMEPFPRNFNAAKKNIELNDLSKKITLLNAGCASKTGEIILDPNQAGAGSVTDSTKNGIPIPLISLEELVSKYHIPDGSVMKIDCEGCEVDVILNSPKEILQKFSQIEIEYHYGYVDIKKKLEESGFKITTSPPLFLRNRQSNTTMFFGYLYATKK